MEADSTNVIEITDRFILNTDSNNRMLEICDAIKNASQIAPVTVNIKTDYIERKFQGQLIDALNLINNDNNLESINITIDKDDEDYIDSMMATVERYPNLVEKVKIIN